MATMVGLANKSCPRPYRYIAEGLLTVPQSSLREGSRWREWSRYLARRKRSYRLPARGFYACALKQCLDGLRGNERSFGDFVAQ